eukprot:Platyproteum_vivax@DN5950_c0_g1_i3.p1
MASMKIGGGSGMEMAAGMMAPTPPSMGAQVDLQTQHRIGRGKLLKNQGNWLPEHAFKKRKAFFNKPSVGVFHRTQQENDKLPQPPDVNQMMGPMKSQMGFFMLQGVLAYWTNFLFSGFLVAKAPFPLTFKFKGMLQRGINVAGLDSTYVSSLSWFFFNLFGSQGLLQVIQHLTEKVPVLEEFRIVKPTILQQVAAETAANPFGSYMC